MFDAGGIASLLKLDISGFAGGMLQATSIAEAFPPVVTAFLANPLLGFIEVGKLASDAAKTVGTAWLDAIMQIGSAADDAGESAAKLGVSVEFLTGWGAAFKDAGSSAEGLADALKFLNKNASEAANGSETAVKAFRQLGISQEFVKTNLGSTEAMARKVFDALSALPTAAERTNVAMDLLGRGGSDLGAALGGGSKGLDEFAAKIARLGGTISTDLAASGDKFGTLMTEVDAAIVGIKKAAAEPVLKLLKDHFGDVEQGVEAVAGNVQKWVAEAVDGALKAGQQAITWIQEHKKDVVDFTGALRDLGTVIEPVVNSLKGMAGVVADLVGLAREINSMSNGLFGSMVRGAIPGGGIADPSGQFQSNGAASGPGAHQVLPPINVTVRADDASSQIANKIRPEIQAAAYRVREARNAQIDQLKLDEFFNVPG